MTKQVTTNSEHMNKKNNWSLFTVSSKRWIFKRPHLNHIEGGSQRKSRANIISGNYVCKAPEVGFKNWRKNGVVEIQQMKQLFIKNIHLAHWTHRSLNHCSGSDSKLLYLCSRSRDPEDRPLWLVVGNRANFLVLSPFNCVTLDNLFHLSGPIVLWNKWLINSFNSTAMYKIPTVW